MFQLYSDTRARHEGGTFEETTRPASARAHPGLHFEQVVVRQGHAVDDRPVPFISEASLSEHGPQSRCHGSGVHMHAGEKRNRERAFTGSYDADVLPSSSAWSAVPQ